jgi:hypothetical protein
LADDSETVEDCRRRAERPSSDRVDSTDVGEDQMSMPAVLRNERRRLMRRIRELVTPHFWNSGYCIGPIGASRPYKLVAFEKPKVIPRRKGAVESILGFTEEGVMEDAYAGGCVTTPLTSFPLEDLYKLEKIAERAGELKRNRK